VDKLPLASVLRSFESARIVAVRGVIAGWRFGRVHPARPLYRYETLKKQGTRMAQVSNRCTCGAVIRICQKCGNGYCPNCQGDSGNPDKCPICGGRGKPKPWKHSAEKEEAEHVTKSAIC
jgi:hypothetical protein